MPGIAAPGRRRWLQGAAAWLLVGEALAQDRGGSRLQRVRGEVRVDGELASEGRRITGRESIATGPGAEAIVVVGRDVLLLRENTEAGLLAQAFRVATGAVLTVFTPGQRKRVETSTAVIGIRGTGLYVEVEPDRTYACTCYGEAILEPRGAPQARERVRTRYHEQPRYIYGPDAPQRVARAPVINHTDAELTLIESIVRRRPPFAGRPGSGIY